MVPKKEESELSSSSFYHGCHHCSRLCEEAKSKVKSLEKRLYVLTIVCTSAITLLGEKGVQALISSINGVQSAMSAATDIGKGSANKDEHKDQNNDKKQSNALWGQPFTPFYRPKTKPNYNQQENRDYQITDELARFPKQNDIGGVNPVDPPISIVNENKNLTNTIVKAALSTDSSFLPSMVAESQSFSDPYAVFFTPSLLPFDVYSTTLALGNNYGFGEYYGIDSGGSYVPPSVPSPGPAGFLVFSQFLHTRKRV